jgi:hypothetical protein
MAVLWRSDGDVLNMFSPGELDDEPHSGWFADLVASEMGITVQAASGSLIRLVRLGYLDRTLAMNGLRNPCWMYTIARPRKPDGATRTSDRTACHARKPDRQSTPA